MVKKCVLCKQTAAKDNDITFHWFPRNARMKNLWLVACELKMEDITPDSRLCSQHFPEDCFSVDKKHGRKLKKSAVPVVFKKPEPVTSSHKTIVPAVGCEIEVETTNSIVVKNEVEEEIEISNNGVAKNVPNDGVDSLVLEETVKTEGENKGESDTEATAKAEVLDEEGLAKAEEKIDAQVLLAHGKIQLCVNRENHLKRTIKYYQIRARLLTKRMQSLRTLVRKMRNNNELPFEGYDELQEFMRIMKDKEEEEANKKEEEEEEAAKENYGV